MKDLYDENLDKVSSAIDEIFGDEQKFKKSWANMAKRNVAFANGDQNPSPSGAPVMVNNQPINVQKDNRQNMYQTNEIEAIRRTIISYMTRAQPVADVVAATGYDKDENIAKVANRLNEALYDINDEYFVSNQVADWAITVGGAFVKDFWDYTLGDYRQQIDYDGNPVLDPETGEPMMDNAKTGGNDVVVLTPLSMSLDYSVTQFSRQPYIGEAYVMDVDWAREAFDRDMEGYTGKASQIEEDGYIGDTLSILEDMKFAVPYLSHGGADKPKSKGKCLIREWYMRPNHAFPKGRLVIKAGNQIVYGSPAELGSPYYAPYPPIEWHPYSAFFYENYLGRLLGKSLVEMLIPLQMRLNEINGAILENANTLAKPNILAAEGQLKKGVLNGKGANVYTYRPVPNAREPHPMQGTPLPAQFFKEKQDLIDQMVRIAGTNFVMQGQPPSGVTAASAIHQLLENANNQHSDLMKRWGKFHERRYTKKLRIIKKFHKWPDRTLNEKLRELSQGSLETQIDDFVGARDLSDGIRVKIQEGSMIPKSHAAKVDSYKELAKEGVLDPALGEDSPRGQKARHELMEKMELEPLESEESSDYKKAKWENDRLLKGLPVEVSPYDNAKIHLPIHIAQLQDPEFLENATDEQKIALYNHIQETEQAEADKALAAIEEEKAVAEMDGAQGPGPEVTPEAPQVPMEGPMGPVDGQVLQ